LTTLPALLILDAGVHIADFNYNLPAELIAQFPAPKRDQSRLLVLHRHLGSLAHRQFGDLLDYLHPGDVLVLNNSKVIPARLRGTKTATGTSVEVFLLEENNTNDWWAMLRPGKRSGPGTTLVFFDRRTGSAAMQATVMMKNEAGHYRLTFSHPTAALSPSPLVSSSRPFDLKDYLDDLGEVPLPPYIERPPKADLVNDNERYQTVYAHPPGSVAAPTAGLHFTHGLLNKIRLKDVKLCWVTLHVGPGTFAPVKTEKLTEHPMHAERFQLSDEAAGIINNAKANRQRIIAVGTTSVRVLESNFRQNQGRLVGMSGDTRLFIYPPYEFKVVDGLLTNFHLPKSTLLMLVSAFAAPGEEGGNRLVLGAYAEAIRQKYRFFSYGDAMLII
jgi:S-adenosylmethionine:tRNA ribosyltransferase-isomerase